MLLFNAGGGLILSLVDRDRKKLVYLFGDPRCTIDYYQYEGDRWAAVQCISIPYADACKCRYRAVIDSGYDEVRAVEYVIENGVMGGRHRVRQRVGKDPRRRRNKTY